MVGEIALGEFGTPYRSHNRPNVCVWGGVRVGEGNGAVSVVSLSLIQDCSSFAVAV